MWTEVAKAARGMTYYVDAPEIGDRFEITVLEPFPGAANLGRKFPSLYVLDPSATLDIVVGSKRLFDIFSGGVLPPTYIVGIGYADPNIEGRRFRDFTPSVAPLPEGVTAGLQLGLGGASAFLDFIERTVVPGLESEYPLEPRDRALLGYSLSGRFVTHVLLSRPNIFARYLIIGPSLWWDSASVFEDETVWATTHDDLAAKVFFVAGDSEEAPGGDWRNNVPDEVAANLKQVSHLRELAGRLAARNYPSLKLKTAFIPGGRHITAFPAAVALGLVELYSL